MDLKKAAPARSVRLACIITIRQQSPERGAKDLQSAKEGVDKIKIVSQEVV